MTHRYKLLTFSALGLLALGACSDGPRANIKNGQYWQRVSASEAAWQQGPKVQQMLNRDIGRCVTELRELENIGAVKDAIPTDAHGRVLDPDELALYDWDTPERDGHLMAEHSNYHDFETCMLDKGWERVKYVPFDVARRAEEDFYRANVKYKNPDKMMEEKKQYSSGKRTAVYDNLNR